MEKKAINPTHIEHIGIVVKNLQESILYWESIFGLECYRVEDVADQKVRTAFFKIGDTKIELLEAMDTESPVARFLEKRGEGVHHIAFAVNDVDKALNLAADMGLELIDKKSRPGAEGLQIGFLHPKSTQGVLTEFCAKPKKGGNA